MVSASGGGGGPRLVWRVWRRRSRAAMIYRDCLDLFVGHRRECVDGRVDGLAFGVCQRWGAWTGRAGVTLGVRLGVCLSVCVRAFTCSRGRGRRDETTGETITHCDGSWVAGRASGRGLPGWRGLAGLLAKAAVKGRPRHSGQPDQFRDLIAFLRRPASASHRAFLAASRSSGRAGSARSLSPGSSRSGMTAGAAVLRRALGVRWRRVAGGRVRSVRRLL